MKRLLCKIFGHVSVLHIDAVKPMTAWYDRFEVTQSHRECRRCGVWLAGGGRWRHVGVLPSDGTVT